MSNLNFHAKPNIPTIPDTENYRNALNEKIAKNTKTAEKVENIGIRKNCGKREN